MRILGKNCVIIFLAIFVFSKQNAFAQGDSELERQIWAMANLNWRLSEKWVYNEDIAYQHSFATPEITRLMLRSQISLRITEAFSVQGGVIFFYNFIESDYNTYEFRPWVGAKLRGPSFWRLDFENNLRMEQRFEYSDGTNNWITGFRFRYKIGTNVPINHSSLIDKTLYGIIAYEFYGEPFNKDVRFTAEAVHRFDLGIGYKQNVKNRYEAVAVAFDTPDDTAGGYSVKNIVLFLKYKRYFNWE